MNSVYESKILRKICVENLIFEVLKPSFETRPQRHTNFSIAQYYAWRGSTQAYCLCEYRG